MLTVVTAASEGFLTINPSRFAVRPPAKITLFNDSMVSGGIIRLLDRGIILLGEPGGQIIYIPKDQIRRIDNFLRS